MKPIVTLTLNPSLDVSCEADAVQPTHKTRTYGERLEPGGGGINVARALAAFGAPTRAVYLAGGASGDLLDTLLAQRGIERVRVPIDDQTRVSLNVRERKSGLEYRFVPEGPAIAPGEWRATIARIEAADCDYFVASGSLPRGIADDAYAVVGAIVERGGARLVLDTSGPELRAALERGGIFLAKPSRSELEQLAGRELPYQASIARAAGEIVRAGQADNVAVTLAGEGALFVNRDGAFALPAVPVEAVSAVGAGDSFLAGMTYAFATGGDWRTAFRTGIAAGAAAVQAPGIELCSAADVKRLLPKVGEPQPVSA